MRRMVVIVPELTGYASIRHIAVSLPYVAALIGEKYMLPGDVKAPEGVPSINLNGRPGSGRRERRQCARWSGWRRHVTPPNSWARNCESATIASGSARDCPGLATPRPRVSWAISSASHRPPSGALRLLRTLVGRTFTGCVAA